MIAGGVELFGGLASFLSAVPVIKEWGDVGDVGMRAFAIFVLLIINGFFVAAEYALVRVQRGQLEERAEAGKSSARLAVLITGRLDAYLAACQLGITMASVALGWLGLPLVARVLQPLLAMTGAGDGMILWVSVIVAFFLVVFLHVVIGELIPKFLATHNDLATAQAVARPLRGFYLLFSWVIGALNFTAEAVVRLVFRIDAAAERDKVHSGDELRILVEKTEQGEDVTDTERKILMNALELNDLTVRDIMTPRTDVVTLDVEKPLVDNLRTAIESQHTRFPLVSGHLDQTIGMIHIKDIAGMDRENGADLQTIRRDIIDVQELMPLDTLLKTFLGKHAHMALVKDEFGNSLGLVMLDDVVEELVGEIQDEFDEPNDGFHRLSEEEFIVAGSLPLHELAHECGITVDTTDVSTVGGYVTHVIGHLPKVGETMQFENYSVTVSQADERSVRELRFKLSVKSPSEAGLLEELGNDLSPTPDSGPAPDDGGPVVSREQAGN